MRLVIKRGALGAPIAVVLSLVLASQAFAATWAPRVRLTSSGNASAHGMVTLGSTTAIALYDSGPHLYVRRSTDSGVNWSPKVRLTRTDIGLGLWADIHGRLNFVDVAFDEHDFNIDVTNLRYRRSTNSGSTFQPGITLRTVSGDDTMYPGVGHGPGGVVAVAWHELGTDTVRVRVSTDDGMSFAPAQTLATLSGSTWLHPPAVAVGNGVIYVAYFIDSDSIRLRRSLDNGATWRAPVTLGNNGSESWTIDTITATARGDKAFVGFTVDDGTNIWTRFRRTNNKGATWSAQQDLSPRTSNPSLAPELTLQGSTLHAAYQQCTAANCNTAAVMYRRRTTSTPWGAPEPASHAATDWATPAGVGQATRVIVVYTADNGDTNPYEPNTDVYVRTGTP